MSREMTLKFTQNTDKRMHEIEKRTGLSRIDVIRRAIATYDFCLQTMDEGGTVVVRSKGVEVGLDLGLKE